MTRRRAAGKKAGKRVAALLPVMPAARRVSNVRGRLQSAPDTPPKSAPKAARASGDLAAYERAVRLELEKKLGPGSASTDVRSTAYHQIVTASMRALVHPRACAGVIVIASGLAPEKMPPLQGALCCGQQPAGTRRRRT